jgi:GH25 family lysozyme M1 (1,4-beta-N-acetylmuramidase)
MKVGIDVSRYQKNVDYQYLKDTGVVKFLIAKSSQADWKDPMYPIHQAGANSAGLLFGAYHWFDPFCNIDKQVKVVLDQCRENCQFVAIDFEQYGHTYLDLPPQMGSANLTTKLMQFKEALSSQLRDVGLYSRATFVLSRAPELVRYLPRFDFLWWASYPSKLTQVLKSWSELRLPDPRYMFKPVGWNADWDIWQFSGDKIQAPGVEARPGVRSNIDLNMMKDFSFEKLSRKHTKEWCRVIATPYLNVRDIPSTINSKVVSRVYPGTTHDILEWDLNGIWCRIERGWICSYFNTPYIEVIS